MDVIISEMKHRRIAVFADIHGNLEALDSILTDIAKKGITEIVSLGDVISIGPNSKECLDLIMQKNVSMLLGNHELYCLYGFGKDNAKVSDGERKHHEWINSTLSEEHFAFLKKSKKEHSINFNDKEIYLSHYPMADDEYIDNKKDYAAEDIYDILPNKHIGLFGHTHRQKEYHFKENSYYVLPSAGCTNDSTTSYMIMTIDENGTEAEFEYPKYDRKKFENKLKNSDYPDIDFIKKAFFKIDI